MPSSTAGPSGSTEPFARCRDVSNEFASILDLDELLSKVASSVRSLINYDAFSILLVDAAPGAAAPVQHALRQARQPR